MTTGLAELRSQLKTVVARRRTARRVIGLSAVLLAVLWSVAAFFLLDWLFSLGRLERLVLLAILAGAVGVVYWFLGRPWLWRQEDEIDVALLVEKQRGIDSDLVAALEFECPQAQNWGSPQLREAVIEYVTDYGREWNLLADFPRDQMKRRAVMVGVTLALLTLVALLLPRHTFVMLNRLALGTMHYPTRTRIAEIAVGGEVFTLTKYGQHGIFARRPFGDEVELTVRCDSEGELPERGALRLRGEAEGARTTLTLEPEPEIPGVYKARLPRLVDSLAWTVELGDARTDAARLEVVARPVVTLSVQATPPAYAKNRVSAEAKEATSRRQVAVFEGSRVDLEIACENKKLTSAIIAFDNPADKGQAKIELPLVAADDTGARFKLPAEKTPLEEVTGPVHFTINVVDEDGLGSERPIEGTINVEIDRPPQGEMQLASRKCVPKASPRIDFTANDDYAISAVNIRAQVRRAGSTKTEEVVQGVWKQGQPTASKGLPLTGQFQFDMLPLKLSPGDQVALSLEVQDYRGKRAPQSALSAPEFVAIVDPATFETAQQEHDVRTDQLLGDLQNTLIGTENKR